MMEIFAKVLNGLKTTIFARISTISSMQDRNYASGKVVQSFQQNSALGKQSDVYYKL